MALQAYRPALAFYADSYQYLQAAADLRPPLERPLGYPLLLRLVSTVGSIGLVPALQHLLALGVAVGIYAVLLHRSCPCPVAALAAAPLLLDAYQLNIEQFVLSETLFSALLLALLALLLWWSRPPVAACAAMGVLAAGCTLTRTVALPITILIAAILALRHVGIRRLVTYLAAALLPLAAYAGWFSAQHGTFGLERIDGRLIYGKVAPLADCARLRLPAAAQVLCDLPPAAQRGSPNYYTWNRHSPAFRLTPASAAADHAYRSFAWAVIAAQPQDYAATVARELYHYALPGRVQRPGEARLVTWRFFTGAQPGYTSQVTPVGFDRARTAPRVAVHPAALLRAYQRFAYTPGTLLALCGLAALAAAGWPGGDRRLRLDCLLLAGVGVVLAVLPALTVEFDYRFLLPELVVLPPAAALAVRRLPQRAENGSRLVELPAR